MSKPNIKLLALDMDGTTYHDGGDIVKENIPAIQAAQKAGVEVVIATGRPALAPQNNFIKNGLGKYGKSAAIACNGGCVYDFANKKLLAENPIDAETAKKVFELVHTDPDFKDVEMWGYVDDLKTVISTKVKKHTWGYNFEHNFLIGKYMYFEDIKPEDFNYKFFKMLAFESNDKADQKLRDMGLSIAVHSRDHVDEINAHGVSKASAVAQVAKMNNIPQEDVMAIGDGANDLPMVEWAGWGVSLENSIPAIKETAQIQVPRTNEQAGVAYAINKYILNKDVD